MIDDGKRVAAGGARLQWHIIPIADIDRIARNRFAAGEELNGAIGTSDPAAAGPRGSGENGTAGIRATSMGKPRGQNGREHMSQRWECTEYKR